MSIFHRAQLLLKAEQHEALAEIAEREVRSISDLVREIVRHRLAGRDREAQISASLQRVARLIEIRTRLREEQRL